MAVRLDIRPRLTLRNEPVAKVRRGPRLPPLTFPAVTYWLAMGALTYAFAHLDDNPLQAASLPAAETEAEPEIEAEPQAQTQTQAASNPEPAPAPQLQPEPEPEPRPELEPEPELALAHSPEPARRANREAGRRGERRSEIWRAFEQAEPAPALSLPADPPRMSFPEFTDSSRPRTAERASSGPRIDSDLFGGGRSSPRPDGAPAPDSAPPESDASAPSVGSSCEAAIARNNEELTIGAARGAPDITRGAYAAILENGRYLSGCSIPDRTVFEVCAAVQNGRALGITVVSTPANPKLNACVRRAVSRLKFPQNSRLDVTRTRFDRAGR